MRVAPRPKTFDMGPSQPPASSYQPPAETMASYYTQPKPSSSPPITPAQITEMLQSLPAPSKPRAGPQGFAFGKGESVPLPPSSVDREAQRLQAAHEFITPKRGNPEDDEVDELQMQEDNRSRGKAILEGAMESEENRGNVFYHAVFGSEEGVRRAVEQYGGDVRGYDSYGFTPLHYASRRPAIQIVTYLLSAGADVHAISKGNVGDLALCAAAESGDLQVIHCLLQAGADINQRNGISLTPLSVAIKSNKRLAAAFLLQNGADPEISDIEGHSALHWAAYRGQTKVVELLLASGRAGTKTADNNGMLPIHWATVRGHIPSLQAIYAADPSLLKVCTLQGLTPLQMADKYKQSEAAAFLAAQEGTYRPSDDQLTLMSFIADAFGPTARPFLLPAVMIPLMLVTGAYLWWLWALVGFVVLALVGNRLVDLYSKQRNPVLMGTGLWSHLYSNVMYFSVILPATPHLWLVHIPFFLINVAMYENYRRLAFDDPGYIEANRGDMLRLIEDLSHGRDTERYCSTCWVYKPYRSKHCRDCGRCVLKSDHHCPFTGNCVAANNLGLFYITHSCYVVCELAWAWLCYQYALTFISVVAAETTSVWGMFGVLRLEAPLVWAMLCWHMFHSSWMFPLWVVQTWQVCRNLTTNESWNRKRYSYLRDPVTGLFNNPFDRGVLSNLHELFYCRYREIYQRTASLPERDFSTLPAEFSLLPTRTQPGDAKDQ